MTIDQTNLGKCLGYGIRASLFAAAPAYVFMRGASLADKSVVAIAVVYAPAMAILGFGVAEATVRTVAQLFLSFVKQQDKEYHLKAAAAEFGTAHRLLRGAVMPIDGYSLVAVEIYRFVNYSKGDRSLIQDYYVYHTPFIITKHTYTHIIVPIGKTTWKVMIVFKDGVKYLVVKPAWTITKHTCRFGYNVLDAVGFWTGLSMTASFAGSLIAAGVGLASSMLGNRR